jgi:WD40 repeat protein
MSLNLRYSRLGLMTLFSLVLLLLNSDLRAGQVTECAARDNVLDVAISHDGQLVAATWWRGGAKLWDTQTGELKYSFDEPDRRVEIELSRDGRLLLASDGDVAILWDTQDGKKLHTFELNPENTTESLVYFTPDEKPSHRTLNR